MKYSFIIASLEGGQPLVRCIRSIENTYEHEKNCDIEVLVVFQDVDAEINRNMMKYPDLIKFYRIEEKGLSVSRNYAIKKSRGDFLVFLDDDAQVKENFLKVLMGRTANPSGGVLCGSIIEKDTGKCFAECFEENKEKKLNFIDFRFFMGSSHIFSRDILGQVGLYDENFGVGARFHGAEESDMFFRAKSCGIDIFYVPELVFYHPRSMDVLSSKVFNYSYAVGGMLTKRAFEDFRHLLIFLFIVFDVLARSAIRSLQNIFFTETIALKNKRYRYSSVFMGTLKGIVDYIKFRRDVQRREL